MTNTLEQQKSELQKFMEESQRKQKEELTKWLEAEKAKMEMSNKDKQNDVRPKTTTSSDVKGSMYDPESRDTSTSFNFRSATNKESSSVLDDTKSLLQKTPVIFIQLNFYFRKCVPFLIVKHLFVIFLQKITIYTQPKLAFNNSIEKN